MIPRPRALLIDATTYLYRAYFAIRSLIGRDGSQVNAVYGFTRTLIELLEEWRPEYAAAAFDDPATPPFRARWYPAYKAHRPAPPERLTGQQDLAMTASQALGIPALQVPGYEGEDILATFVRRLRAHGIACVVVGTDKDLAQLVGPDVWLYPHGQGEPMDAEAIRERFGVPPERVADLLALRGDRMDNIPGLPGIGATTARRLLADPEPIDRLLTDVAALERLGLARATALRDGQERFRANRMLTTLRDDVPLNLPDEALAYSGIHTDAIRTLCDQLGFDRLRDRILEVAGRD